MTLPHPLRPPEVMSPAGHWPELLAAVEAGADAVYFGLTHFTARAKVGFRLAELPEVMAALHERAVRGYVTVNTLVFDHELNAAARALAGIAEAGADAIIVQDPAVARLARGVAPHLELHGSTQMSVTSAEGIALAQSWGVTRVVLARELSLDQIRAIRADSDCQLEMFVHGALCVSYSGQCFSSEAWGGRSANRGQCAQACRLPYELLVDGRVQPLGDARYLLSPGDLYALRQIPQIVAIGLSALKIEGRYKGPAYVALTTRAYRQAVDEAWAGRPLSISPVGELQLEQVYSRGMGPWFATGTDHQVVVDGRAPRHRGVRAGTVVRVTGDGLVVAPGPACDLAPLKAGDGIVLDAADRRSPDEPEEGGRVYGVTAVGDGIGLAFGRGDLDLSRVRAGDWVWRTHDADVDREARPYLQAGAPVRRQPVRARVTARVGQALQIEWWVAAQPRVRAIVRGDSPLAAAQRHGLTRVFLQEQLGRLGGTAYELAGVELDMEGSPFVPASFLGPLRRRAVESLAAQQRQVAARGGADPDAVVAEAQAGVRERAEGDATRAAAAGVHLHLLVRTPEQLDAALELAPASVTLDYLDLYGLRPAVDRVRARGVPLRVASPRVLKPGEEGIVAFLRRLDCPLLVRSGGLLQALRRQAHPPLTGDFSLNAANAITAATLLELGLERITPTHDLNGDQVARLARQVGADRLEVVAFHHLPVFHTEHCVFCRFLSTGTSYRDCGRPCERHRIALRDTAGRAHPVLADVGCRNTVFGAQAQEASRHLDAWLGAGIRHLRLEFAHETAAQVEAVFAAFAEAGVGWLPARALAARLREAVPEGTTEGSLFVPEGYLEVPSVE